MVLAGVVPEIALYMHLGAHMTHSYWYPLGVLALLWFMNTVVAIHRADPFDESDGGAPMLIILLNFVTPSAAILGAATGVLYASVFQLPPLLDPELWRVYRGADGVNVWLFNAGFWRFSLAGVAAGVGGNFLLGNFEPEVSSSASLVLGLTLLIGGVLVILYTWARWIFTSHPSDWLNALSALFLVLYMLTPALYDFTLQDDSRLLAGLLVQLYLAAISVIAVFSFKAFYNKVYNDTELEKLVQNDVRFMDSSNTTRRQFVRWGSIWVPVAIVYIVGWWRDWATLTPAMGEDAQVGDPIQVALGVAITQIALLFIGLVWAWINWRYVDKRSTRGIRLNEGTEEAIVGRVQAGGASARKRSGPRSQDAGALASTVRGGYHLRQRVSSAPAPTTMEHGGDGSGSGAEDEETDPFMLGAAAPFARSKRK